MHNFFKQYRNKVTNEIKFAKRKYYENTFESAKCNITQERRGKLSTALLDQSQTHL